MIFFTIHLLDILLLHQVEVPVDNGHHLITGSFAVHGIIGCQVGHQIAIRFTYTYAHAADWFFIIAVLRARVGISANGRERNDFKRIIH